MSSRTLFDEEALAAPSEAKSPKVEELADAIAALSLMEAADLVDVLKTKLNIADVPMMAMGGGGGGGGAAPAEEAPVVAKTEFTIKLESFDAATKIKLIKEVRSLTSLGLKEVRIRSRGSRWRLVCVSPAARIPCALARSVRCVGSLLSRLALSLLFHVHHSLSFTHGLCVSSLSLWLVLHFADHSASL